MIKRLVKVIREFKVILEYPKIPLIIVESDDWGFVRNAENHSHGNVYDKIDTLESKETFDLIESLDEKMVETLGLKFVLVCNFIMFNAEYDTEWKHMPFLHYYSGSEKDSLFQLVDRGVVYPQLHGFSHFNDLLCEEQASLIGASQWNLIRSGSLGVRVKQRDGRDNYMAELDRTLECKTTELRLVFALEQFKKTFGFSSISFIAPANVIGINHEHLLFAQGVKFLQCYNPILRPFKNGGRLKENVRFGEEGKAGLIYVPRNIYLEPSVKPYYPWRRKMYIKVITLALLGRPIIVSTHRVNFLSKNAAGVSENIYSLLFDIARLSKKINKKYRFGSYSDLKYEK